MDQILRDVDKPFRVVTEKGQGFAGGFESLENAQANAAERNKGANAAGLDVRYVAIARPEDD